MCIAAGELLLVLINSNAEQNAQFKLSIKRKLNNDADVENWVLKKGIFRKDSDVKATKKEEMQSLYDGIYMAKGFVY